MEFEEILKIENIKVVISKFKESKKRKMLIDKTYFLPEDANIGERIYCLINNISERPKCYCGNICKYINYSFGYCKNCSRKCSHNSSQVKEKRKNTCLDKYGVTSFTKTEEYLNKTKKTNLEKYGVEFSIKSESSKQKTKKTKIEKYGVEHHMLSEKFKESFVQNNINKFGVDNVSKLESVKRKKKETFQKNYGLDHIFSSNEIKGKMFEIKYGYNPYVSDSEKNEFEKYKESVWKYTYRVKKKLIIEWNGFDYYDGEYIKQNYELDYNDAKYPTIDHKISIFFGFNNKIDASIIGSIENICLTKRSINKQKGVLNENEFIAE